jgi:FkbM family methyltransferase
MQRLFSLAYFQYKRRFEDPFFNLTRRHPEFFSGGHVIDVGANIGYTASVFASAIDNRFKVWAFEPQGENFRRLESTIATNSLADRVEPIQSAVGDAVGETEIAVNALHPGDHRISDGAAGSDTERVKMTTVDDFVRSRSISPVAFIKIDVQGYEQKVCRGMAETLAANPAAVVVVEYLPASLREYGSSPRELMEFFSSRGYQAYRLAQNGMLHPFDMAAPPEKLPPPGYIDLLLIRLRSDSQS